MSLVVDSNIGKLARLWNSYSNLRKIHHSITNFKAVLLSVCLLFGY